ncbi:uncharacterized protein LOC133798494 [Humulus lupulus]|uniref:uncharacterized protein LOC133798494 n=1 Tax=Humulus lupulus TaxID=3486 RepID=UPI002B406E45|nr:uncharacterized protein LOC133798494 [Humulus lupulus]XP_062092768.1 uncharacterized protein LOC133798494 [Humulus lupulus]XP_062092769.1 uncharacterized protein LOC133798494 [Humulus lupulus]XP_062092770.1 uncharacterized protein LOC133798494 [Humulus lupulus]XP_062092771.1 uncharacterized protein LOC133798494 [Humulus lupulus]
MFGVMPVSANEETGVKPVTRQSIDYLAGIPIKKRRFPLIRPPSPPAEEPCLCPAESNSLKKDQSSLSQGSTLSYSSVATTSSGLSDAVKHPEPEERSSSAVNDHVGNINLTKVKVEEPSPAIQPGSAANMNGEEKLVKAKDSVGQTILLKNELKPAGFDMPIKDRTEVKVEPEVAALQENSKSLLNLKEQFVLALSSQNSGSQNQEILEPISLNLSLSKERSSSYCKSNVGEVNVSSAHLCANRANWDLNTPMDTWEGSLSDAAVNQTAGGMVSVGQREDTQPLIRLAVTSEKPSSIESKNVTDFSRLSSCKDKPGDSLHLQLSPSCLNFPIKEPSTASPKLDTNKVIPMTNMPRVVLPSINLGKDIIRPVKSEPIEERIKLDTRGAKSFCVGSLESAVVKRELADQGGLETVNPSVDSRSIKSGSALECNKVTISSVHGMSLQSNEQMVECPDKHFSTAAVTGRSSEVASPVNNPSSSAEYKPSGETIKTAEITCPVVNSSFSTVLVMGGEHIKQSEKVSSTSAMHRKACESSRQFTLDMAATSASIDVKVDTTKPECSNIDNSKLCESKVTNDLPLLGDGEGSVSDEEKINISAEIGDSYSSDYESDGNHAVDMTIDMELDSDYEDGEVREPIEHTAVEVPECKKGQSEHADISIFNRKVMGTMGFVNDADHAFHVEGKDSKRDSTEIDKKGGEEASGVLHSNKCESGFTKAACFQESLTTESSASRAPIDEINNAALSIPPSESGKRDAQECQDTNLEQAARGGEATVPAIAQGTGLSLDNDELVLQSDTALAKSSLYFDEGKDIDSGSHRSRIINLPRSSGSSSPGRNRTFSGRAMPYRAGRERFSDVTNERGIVYYGGREEIYGDDTPKFFRERHHDQTARNSRFNYIRGRGRINNRIETFRGDRESDRDFASEFPNSQPEYRVPRHKFASDVDHEYNTYNITQDGGFVGSGRGGRKPLNDEGPFGRRIPSRKQSPGAGPAGRGRHMVRRMPRNISPRCVGEDDSELVRHRRNDKFARSFPDDAIDSPVFSRPHPPFEGVDGHFSQGNRNFPSAQRKVMHHPIRSKSPLSGRNRSPGPWSSPRRRSPYGFSGHPDLTQRSPFYRIDRMRSPDRRCFAGEVVVRRHDMREMDSGRDHGHPGSGMPNRSPSDRIALRERRFGGLDPQERPENDDFFGSHLHELGNDVNGEERRFGERRGPVRPYRTPFNGAEGETFHLNAEDGSRSLRFCPGDDTNFQERGNMIDRDFHIRIKNRPGNAPRRMRNIEEQEANYRHGGQVWHNNEFDEMSRVKRKRF